MLTNMWYWWSEIIFRALINGWKVTYTPHESNWPAKTDVCFAYPCCFLHLKTCRAQFSVNLESCGLSVLWTHNLQSDMVVLHNEVLSGSKSSPLGEAALMKPHVVVIKHTLLRAPCAPLSQGGAHVFSPQKRQNIYACSGAAQWGCLQVLTVCENVVKLMT